MGGRAGGQGDEAVGGMGRGECLSGGGGAQVGFDMSEPTAHNQGTPEAIARIRQRNPYNTVVMIGE